MKEKIAASKTLKKVFLKIAAIVKENILESAFHVDCYQATKMHANNLLPIFPSQTVAVLHYEAEAFYEVAFTLYKVLSKVSNKSNRKASIIFYKIERQMY